MKRFSEMTEEEIVEEGLRALPDYLERIRGTGVFDLGDCVRMELKRVENLYRDEYRPRLFSRNKTLNIAELDAALAHFEPILRQRTIPLRTKYQRSRMVSQIRFAAARPIIHNALKEAGLTGSITAQRYRARVDLDITPNTVLRFYILFRDIGKEGLMDECIRAAVDIRNAIDRLGYGATLKTR